MLSKSLLILAAGIISASIFIPKSSVLGVSARIPFFPTPTPTVTLTPTPTSTPTPTFTPTPTLTPTATPTATPTFTPTPMPATAYEEYFDTYSRQYNVDKNVLKKIAYCESGMGTGASNGDYGGMYQFSVGTWEATRREMGADSNPDLRFGAKESIETAAYKISRNGANAWQNCL
jgi:hypothetical protein